MQHAEPDDFVERVSERSDIYSVVSRYVPLTQKSGRYWGRCPFHNEKTASFCVSPDKGFFYCFGCGAGGNVFKFLSLIENISYFEAVKLQAERLGIDLPTQRYSPEQDRQRREQKVLFQINETAQDFYHECLIKTARGEIGRKYFAGRGITAETIQTFKLGYAPDEWENLLPQLTRRDFTAQQIESVGLIAKRKNSSGYYDRFRARVIIPIADERGRVVGFGGRILGNADESTPKYLNTPETPIFNKRKILFGLDKSARAINTAGCAIVVEGYMDAISLFGAGVQNVVATLGTAFTPDHAKLLLRYARKIIFCYDSDEAGQRATIRALPIVQTAGAEVFIVQVPDGKDPDDFIRKHGKDAFDALIRNASTLIDYRMKYVLARAELATPVGKVQALREILPVVVKIADTAARNEYTKKIAAALYMDETLVKAEWRKLLRQMQRDSAGNAENSPEKRTRLAVAEDPAIREASEIILRMLWHESDMISYVRDMVPREIFSPVNREIFDWLEDCAQHGKSVNELNAASDLSEAAYAQLSRIILGGDGEPRATEIAMFDDSVKILRRVNLKKRYNELLLQAEKYISSDNDAYNQTVRASLKIKQQMDTLKGD